MWSTWDDSCDEPDKHEYPGDPDGEHVPVEPGAGFQVAADVAGTCIQLRPVLRGLATHRDLKLCLLQVDACSVTHVIMLERQSC